MDQAILDKAQKYLELFEAIRTRVGGDERIAANIMQEIAKDRRMEEIREERGQQNGSEPATEKQLKLLRNLDVEVVPEITKRQASAILDRALAKKRNGEDEW